MNAAALSRVKVVSGTPPTQLIQAIKDSILKHRLPGHLETAIYKGAGETKEFLVLSLWENLANIPGLSAPTPTKLALNWLQAGNSEMVSRGNFKMIKDYRIMTAQPALSRIVVFTIPTTNPQLWLEDGVRALSRDIKDWPGLVRVWLGRSVSEPQNSLILLLRMDWLSQQEQQAFMASPLTTAFLKKLRAAGGTSEYGQLSLQEQLLHTEY
jgi:hypothetical protein